jgi:DNA polymerase (family 10)
MTERILSALSNDRVTFMAHPTGRLLNQRNPYEYDVEKVMDFAAAHGVAMEMNAFPSRLDFDVEHARLCVKKGVKLVINTDSHSVPNLDFMEFGIAQARRAWVRKEDVLNALPWKEFEKKVLHH